MNTLSITITPAGQGVVEICIAGEVDMTTAGQVGDAARTASADGPREVHLNMADVTFLDSRGIRTVLEALRELQFLLAT